ncbi:MAG: hypothetical protein KDD58_05600 [Bdellovibrionales bacterium]|nr:hypothetical protein [Bdellovibrionales bacterium]
MRLKVLNIIFIIVFFSSGAWAREQDPNRPSEHPEKCEIGYNLVSLTDMSIEYVRIQAASELEFSENCRETLVYYFSQNYAPITKQPNNYGEIEAGNEADVVSMCSTYLKGICN